MLLLLSPFVPIHSHHSVVPVTLVWPLFALVHTHPHSFIHTFVCLSRRSPAPAHLAFIYIRSCLFCAHLGLFAFVLGLVGFRSHLLVCFVLDCSPFGLVHFSFGLVWLSFALVHMFGACLCLFGACLHLFVFGRAHLSVPNT
jgi:hypothetical protein